MDYTLPEYTLSLSFFLAPNILITYCLFKRKLLSIDQKKSFFLNVFFLSMVGVVLDLAFAHLFFSFPNESMVIGINIFKIPIEEFIFYFSGFYFILGSYIVFNHMAFKNKSYVGNYIRHSKYIERKTDLVNEIVNLSIVFYIVCVSFAVIICFHFFNKEGSFPGYATFLAIFAYFPYVIFGKKSFRHLNIESFILTLFTITALSYFWEVELALPRG